MGQGFALARTLHSLDRQVPGGECKMLGPAALALQGFALALVLLMPVGTIKPALGSGGLVHSVLSSSMVLQCETCVVRMD